MDPDPDEEEMEDVRLNDKIEHHWRVVFKDNYRGVEDEKVFLHAKRRYF